MKRRALPAGMVGCVVFCVAFAIVGLPMLGFGGAVAGLLLFGVALDAARPSNWPAAELDFERDHRDD